MADTALSNADGSGFFAAHERATIEAAMARIIPTDDRPGAREARTIDFLDRYLSGLGFVYAKPDGSGFEVLEGRQAQAWQERIDRIRATYVDGAAELDRRGRSRFKADFVDLTGGQQDRILTDMERAMPEGDVQQDVAVVAVGFEPVEPALQQTSAEIDLAFFPLLALHTRQGFYADPIYGGNHDRVGWELIGFPGPASLAEVHSGRYSTLAWFADSKGYPGTENDRGA